MVSLNDDRIYCGHSRGGVTVLRPQLSLFQATHDTTC